MRGGVYHEFLLDRLEAVFLRQGFRTARQIPSRRGRSPGYIDLVIGEGSAKLLVEVEMCAKRVGGDLRKLADQGANTVLWIVSPNLRVQKAINEKLRHFQVVPKNRVFVLSFGTAIQAAKHIRTIGNLGVVDHKTENNNHKH